MCFRYSVLGHISDMSCVYYSVFYIIIGHCIIQDRVDIRGLDLGMDSINLTCWFGLTVLLTLLGLVGDSGFTPTTNCSTTVYATGFALTFDVALALDLAFGHRLYNKLLRYYIMCSW